MKILPITNDVPEESTRRGHYEPLWEKVRRLKKGEWVPVECQDENEARLIAAGAANCKEHFLARKRGKTVYITKRTA